MLLNFLFSKRKQNQAEGKIQSPGPSSRALAVPASGSTETQLGYTPRLVEELKADHRAILKSFADMEQSHAAGNLTRTAALLEHSRGLVKAHLTKEEVGLHGYLEQALVSDPATHALLHRLRREMDDIGEAVLAFLDTYRDIAAAPALAGNFAADLAAIGKALAERIHREEKVLCPMYLPAY